MSTSRTLDIAAISISDTGRLPVSSLATPDRSIFAHPNDIGMLPIIVFSWSTFYVIMRSVEVTPQDSLIMPSVCCGIVDMSNYGSDLCLTEARILLIIC